MANTIRVELDDGNWIEVRTRVTLGDNEYLEHQRMKRMKEYGLGMEDSFSPQLMAIDTLVCLATAWSYPEPISRSSLLAVIDWEQLAKITGAIGEERNPNSSSASSNGTSRRTKRAAKPRPVGDSG